MTKGRLRMLMILEVALFRSLTEYFANENRESFKEINKYMKTIEAIVMEELKIGWAKNDLVITGQRRELFVASREERMRLVQLWDNCIKAKDDLWIMQQERKKYQIMPASRRLPEVSSANKDEYVSMRNRGIALDSRD